MCSMCEDFAKFEVQSRPIFEHFAVKARNIPPHGGVALSARALFKQEVLKLLAQMLTLLHNDFKKNKTDWREKI